MVYGARAEPAAPSSRCGPHPGADPAPSSEHSAAGVGRIIYFFTCTMFRLRHSGRAGKEQALISRVPCGGPRSVPITIPARALPSCATSGVRPAVLPWDKSPALGSS